MLSKLFIAWCLMALCVTIHSIGLAVDEAAAAKD
jgi:hypothetical protein